MNLTPGLERGGGKCSGKGRETVEEDDYTFEDRQRALDEAWLMVNDDSEKVEQLDIFRFLMSEEVK